MKILHKNSDGKWEQIENAPYINEAELQDLIAEDAGVLPFEDIGYDENFVTIGKEVGLHGNSLDLLAISPKGHIAVIETKLSRNPEIRREVVGQVLSYAASLWKMQYTDIERYFHKYLSSRKIDFEGTLFEYVKLHCKAPDIDEEDFRTGIEKRLELGSFSLLIVVDALGESNKELVSIANYLNDRTGQEIDFYVVEVERIGDKKQSYLLPRLANPPHKSITVTSASSNTENDKYDRKPLTQEEFLERLDSNEVQIAKEFINIANRNNHVGLSWRKTGFSIWTMLPRKLTEGVYNYESGYPYFFFQASEKSGKMYKALSFWYPESSYSSLLKLQPFVEQYRNLYTNNNKYNQSKKEIMIEDVNLDFAKQMLQEIKNTASEIAKLDKDNIYEKSYR